MIEVVAFPGSEYVQIFFDDRCATEGTKQFGVDKVTIYKDQSLTETWGSYWGGLRDNTGWPGVGGRAPLVIPSDTFVVRFESDDTTEDWGFRLRAIAPTSAEGERALTRCPLSDGASVSVEMAKRALVAANNSVPRARAWLEAAERSSDLAALAAASDGAGDGTGGDAGGDAVEWDDDDESRKRGVYRDPAGYVQVNIQTGEVFLQNRMLCPVPTDIAVHPLFAEVLKPSVSGHMCHIMSNNVNSRTIRVDVDGVAHDVVAWTPLRSDSAVAVSSVGSESASGASGDERMKLGNLPDQRCWNMPSRAAGRSDGALEFAGEGPFFISFVCLHLFFCLLTWSFVCLLNAKSLCRSRSRP